MWWAPESSGKSLQAISYGHVRSEQSPVSKNCSPFYIDEYKKTRHGEKCAFNTSAREHNKDASVCVRSFEVYLEGEQSVWVRERTRGREDDTLWFWKRTLKRGNDTPMPTTMVYHLYLGAAIKLPVAVLG